MGRRGLRRWILLLSVVSGLIAVFVVYRSWPRGSQERRSAAIVDGLSEEFPSPRFVSEASRILREGGYTVDVFNASSITVAFYRGLPSRDYEIIVLRVHSAPMDEGRIPGAALFTGENREGLYMLEQLLGWVRMARTLTRGERFYAVTPSFLEEALEGSFKNTTILLMSCYGSIDDTLGRILTGRGAYALVGWTDRVTPEHMDKAALLILEKLVGEGLTLQEAVECAAKTLGPDPVYGGELRAYLKRGG
jgi:hypothetical protein